MRIDSTFAIIGGAALVVLLGVSGWMVMGHRDDPFAPCRHGVVAGGAGALGGSFTLVDEDGQEVTDEQVLDRPALVYFGYSFCPDVCPIDAARNAEAVSRLKDGGMAMKDVFITIDPERDTAGKLKEYTDYFDPDMIGLTGSASQVAAAAKAYRVLYQKQGKGADYLMAHSTFTYLTLPGHGVVDFFDRGTSAQDVADRTACFIDRS